MSSDVSLLRPFTTQQTNNGVYVTGTPTWSAPSTSYTRTSLVNSKVSVSNPRWRSQVKNGDNATTPFSGVFYKHLKIESGHVTAIWTHPFPGIGSRGDSVSGICHNFVPGHLTVPSSVLSSVDGVALSRFYAAARKAQTQISGPTFLGELRETIHMLKSPSSALGKLTLRFLDRVSHPRRRGLRSRVRLPRKEIAKNAARDWLQYVYGVRPLLNDTADIAIAIARLLSETRHTVVRGFAEQSFASSTISDGSYDAFIFWRNHHQQYSTYQVIYRGALKASAFSEMSANLPHLIDLLGFRLDEFVPTVWELIPYSFVVDYFSNVGAILSAAAFDRSKLAWVARTNRQSTICHAFSLPRKWEEVNPGFKLVSYDTSGNLGETKIVVTSVTRTQFVPGLFDISLDFHLPGSVTTYANLLALIASKL